MQRKHFKLSSGRLRTLWEKRGKEGTYESTIEPEVLPGVQQMVFELSRALSAARIHLEKPIDAQTPGDTLPITTSVRVRREPTSSDSGIPPFAWRSSASCTGSIRSCDGDGDRGSFSNDPTATESLSGDDAFGSTRTDSNVGIVGVRLPQKETLHHKGGSGWHRKSSGHHYRQNASRGSVLRASGGKDKGKARAQYGAST